MNCSPIFIIFLFYFCNKWLFSWYWKQLFTQELNSIEIILSNQSIQILFTIRCGFNKQVTYLQETYSRITSLLFFENDLWITKLVMSSVIIIPFQIMTCLFSNEWMPGKWTSFLVSKCRVLSCLTFIEIYGVAMNPQCAFIDSSLSLSIQITLKPLNIIA